VLFVIFAPVASPPVPGDVEAGVAVDATVGTFVVPTPEQVEVDIGFGEDGTEFLGELVSGGAAPFDNYAVVD